DAMFKIPTPLMLSKIVDAIDNLDMSDKDAKGDLYESLLVSERESLYSILGLSTP
ncbi:Type I restriction modification system M subunit, partial [human gut metagenome]